MLDFHPVIYCTIDRNEDFNYINATTAELLGYQPYELVGTPFLSLVAEQDRERTRQIVQHLRNGEFVDRFVNRYHRKDGSLLTLSWSSQWDAEEQLLYGIGHPVPSHQAADELQQTFARKLKQNNQQVLETFDRITDGFVSLDEQWRFIYLNKAAEKCLGVSREGLLAQTIWEAFPSVVGSVFEQEYKRCYEQQVQVQFEAYYPQPLNKIFEVNAYPSPTGISVFFKDITMRKKAEEELGRLSFIVQQTDNLVILCDSDGRIKWVNEAFQKKTEYTLFEVLGYRPGDVLAGPATDAKAIERARNQYRNGKAFQEELLYYTKTQKALWVQVTGQPILDSAGNVREVFSIQVDVTEKKRLEEQLNREQEANQRKITAAVLHAQEQERSEIGKELHDNINQLLTTVKLYLEISLSPEMSRQALIEKSIQLIQASISEIRSLSKRLSAPTMENVTLYGSLKELCANVAATNQFRIRLDAAGLEELEVKEALHLALYRILQEHLTNILKHAAAQNVAVTLEQVNGELVVKVTDDGKGFDMNKKRSGMGITNMITRAESLHGKLWMSSQPGKGTELQLRFPLDV